MIYVGGVRLPIVAVRQLLLTLGHASGSLAPNKNGRRDGVASGRNEKTGLVPRFL